MKSRILTALLLLLVAEFGRHEYFGICRHAGLKPLAFAGYAGVAALALVQAVALLMPANPTLAVFILFVLLVLTVAVFRAGDLRQYLGSISSTILGIAYVGLGLSCLLPLRFSDPGEGRRLIFLLFLVIWAGDICAFFVGRTLGRHLLDPRVSPKKTVEGGIGGLAGSLLVAWGFAHWFWQTSNLKTVILLAAGIAVAGQLGDLAESAMKRAADLKDSGSILPGHGGLLDRIDSLLFGGPALWLAIVLKDFWR